MTTAMVRYRCRRHGWVEWAHPESNVVCPHCQREASP